MALTQQPNLSVNIRKPANRKVVYTATFSNYDDLSDVDNSWDCDFVWITDCPIRKPNNWTQIYVDPTNNSPALLNRYYKILAHRIFHNYEYSLYVDGHVVIKKDPSALFHKYLSNHLIAMPYHPDRDCAYEEASYCATGDLINNLDVATQLAEYRSLGFPTHFGLTENGIILRRHNDPKIVSLMEAWWQEYVAKVRRDQISLPYLLWRERISVANIAEGPRRSAQYFDLKPHKTRRLGLVRRIVWHITTHKHRSAAYLIASKVITLLSLLKLPRAHSPTLR